MAEEAGETPPRAAVSTRRRGSVLEQAILTAAAELLAESGYPGLTMDAVARRAGTNKNALYRRWASRAALGVAAFQQVAEGRPAPPDTGSLRGDAIELLRRSCRDMCSPRGEILCSLLAAARDEPALLAHLQSRLDESGTAMWLTVLGRAVARGEAAPEVLHPRVATAAFTLMRSEYFARRIASVPDGVIIEIVDEVYLPLIRGRSLPPARPEHGGA